MKDLLIAKCLHLKQREHFYITPFSITCIKIQASDFIKLVCNDKWNFTTNSSVFCISQKISRLFSRDSMLNKKWHALSLSIKENMKKNEIDINDQSCRMSSK